MTDFDKLKKCCGSAFIGAGLAWALATFQPGFVDSMPAALKTIYMDPVQFALLVGLLVLIVGGIVQSMNARGEGQTFRASTYSRIRAPETYGYSGLSPAGVGEPSGKIGFKNFV